MDFSSIAEQKNNLVSREPRIVHHPFLLILGPSAVGKTEIIRNLISLGKRYVYINPYTTRPLRNGETDKIPISQDEFNRMQDSGAFAAVNLLYDYSYGTPMQSITSALEQGKVPLVDYPLNRVDQLSLPPNVEPICVYVMPPSIESWYKRMAGAKRVTLSRLKAGYRELQTLATSTDINPTIHYHVVNPDNQADTTATRVHRFLYSLAPCLRQ